MSIDILCNRVHDNIRSIIQWILNIRTHKRVIHHHQNAMPVRNIRDFADIHQTQGRVRGRLNPNQFRVWFEDGFGADFEGWCKRDVYAVRSCDFGEVAMRAAIDVRDGNNVGTGGEGLQDYCCCRGAGGERERVAGVFEGSDGFFEVVPISAQNY